MVKWKAIINHRKEDNPESPKTSKTKSVIKLAEAFADFLR